MRHWIFILLLLPFFTAKCQVYKKPIKLVLKKDIVGKQFTFGKWIKGKNTEIRLKYLGKMTTTKGCTYKLINYSWFWGLSPRATSCILVYNDNDKYIGQYDIDVIDDLPYKFVKGKLFFKRDTDHKNKSQSVNLKNGLPAILFESSFAAE
jgi:hypothetical protein